MVDLFFILLNFASVIVLAYYGFNRYFLPVLKARLEQEKALEQDLHNEHRTLLLTQKQVDETTLAQEADCTTFLNKINQWRGTVHTQKTQKEAEARYLLEEAEKKLYRQSQNHALRTVYQSATPLVVKELEEELKGHFADEQNAHGYLAHVLKNLKK